MKRATASSVFHVDLLCAFMSAVSVELIDRGGSGINLKSLLINSTETDDMNAHRRSI